jgi:hypothetical protein
MVVPLLLSSLRQSKVTGQHQMKRTYSFVVDVLQWLGRGCAHSLNTDIGKGMDMNDECLL